MAEKSPIHITITIIIGPVNIFHSIVYQTVGTMFKRDSCFSGFPRFGFFMVFGSLENYLKEKLNFFFFFKKKKLIFDFVVFGFKKAKILHNQSQKSFQISSCFFPMGFPAVYRQPNSAFADIIIFL
jgi:hypothetical protein